jgi:signal transduction histidine kinase/CheY-like chemotaxis protein
MIAASRDLVRGFERMTALASTFVEGDATAARRTPGTAHALSLAHLERVRLRLAFEQARDALLFVDRRGKVTVANARARELLGPHAQPGAPIAAAFVPVDRDRAARLMRAMRADAPCEVLLTAHTVDADAAVNVRVEHLDEKRTSWTMAPLDGTTRQVERSLRDARELLERERKRARELELANASMKRLLAMLAHDLRGPLNAVLGWAELLRREHLDRKARDRGLAAIVRSARTQNALIEEILDVARMSQGKLQVDLAVCDLGRIARQAVETFAPNAGDAGLTIRYDGAGDDHAYSVIGDPRRIEQILSNLIANAIKYSRPGGRIDVVVTGQRDHVRLDVADTGRGIAPALLPNLFGWCAQDTTHPEDARAGLGLGLYIVKQLVELQGGSVAAESAGEGHGATFRVSLCRAKGERAPLEPAAELPPLHGRRVLVVGDDETNVELLASVLRRRGAHILQGLSVGAAAALVDHGKPDVVVCDFDANDPSFGATLEAVRRLAGDCPSLVVVRPFEPAVLVETVRRACSRR